MPGELEIIKRKLSRIETMLAEVLHKNPELARPARITEREAISRFNVTRTKLKTMRLGYYRNGQWHDPVLLKWGHRNHRHIDYDLAELEEALKPTLAI